MSSYSNELAERRRVSKVTFSSISSDILAVKIRKVSTEVREEDIPKMSGTFASISSDPNQNENRSQFTMTDTRETATTSSQTVRRGTSKSDTKHDSTQCLIHTAENISRKAEDVSAKTASWCNKCFASISSNPNYDQNENRSQFTMTDTRETATTSSQTIRPGTSKSDTKHDSTPCLKHAAENISRKAEDVSTEKANWCNNCSKSMVSYIFVVQDFLDSLVREIRGSDTPHCLQCAREEVRDTVASSGAKDGGVTNSERAPSVVKYESKQKDINEDRHAVKKHSRTKGHRQDSKRSESYRQDSKRSESHQKGLVNPPQGRENQRQQMDFTYNVSPTSNIIHEDGKTQNLFSSTKEKRITVDEPSSENKNSSEQTTGNQQNIKQQWTATDNSNPHQQWTAGDNQRESDSHQVVANDIVEKSETTHGSSASQQTGEQSSTRSIFIAPRERLQPNYDAGVPVSSGNRYESDSNNNPAQSPTLFKDGVDGIVSTLSNVEREIYDSARNRAGWEGLSGRMERTGLSQDNLVASEAFVTFCRNNAEAIGCLVVGTSLLLCRTTRTLCVLVSDGVSTAFRGALSSVFQVVQYVRSLDSLGTTKLALLEQPELGITFSKLNIWRLDQFTKCVFLNPDTLVVQNCDELFVREELSAVPDIGWPDCFNSGVFVYSPSVRTFWELLEFAEKQGSFDGGDQGLLNSYFTTWSSDINKKLSFIYNLMANVSYTYAPAYRQFGRDVKIVQFYGSFKPWHVKFFTASGQISPSSPVHPTYVQFVHIWLSIFRISVLRLMSQEIQSYAASQETICAVETLRFFPLPSESESDFFLTPPSVRLRLAEKKMMRPISLPVSEARRRKSAEFLRYNSEDDIIPETSTPKVEAEKETTASDAEKSGVGAAASDQEKLEPSAPESDDVLKEEKEVEEKVIDENALPGAEVGNYQGMKAWEQGRMDYQGKASSDNVIKRLEFLMSRPS